MFRIFVLILIFVSYSPNLFSQVKIPKCYNDYEITSNVDSLEKYVYAHRENPLVYLHGLINLELSRGIYKDEFGQDVNTIKTIAAEQNDELGKVVGLMLEAPTYILANSKVNALENMYWADEYFTRTKDTLGVLTVCDEILGLLYPDSFSPIIGLKQSYEFWFQKVMAWGQKTSQAKARLTFYQTYIKHYNLRINTSKKDLNEEFDMLRLALDIIKKLPNQAYHKYCIYTAFGWALDSQEPSEEYLKYSLLTYKMSENLNCVIRFTAIYNLGCSYKSLKKCKEAEQTFKESYVLFKKQKIIDDEYEISILNDLSEVQYQQKKYKVAYENKILADSLAVILNEKVKSDNIIELETKYEVEKKEVQNALLLTEKKRLETRNLLSLLLIMLTLGFLIFLWQINLNLKKNREALSASKLKLEESALFRERLFGIIAHDIRSPISAYSDLSQTCAYLIKHKRWDNLETISNQLDKVSYGLNTLLDNLLFWLKSGQDEEATKTTIPLQNTLNGIIQIYKEIAQVRDIRLELDNSPNPLEIQCEAQAFQLIVRNLVDNAIKNTDKGELIIIQTTETAERVIIGVVNKPKTKNSIIIQAIQQLFDSSDISESNQNGLGLGLILVKEFATANHATMKLIENPDDTLCFQVGFSKKN
jgi:signal transduction histidine kinase